MKPEPFRVVIPPTLLAQLRERRAQQRTQKSAKPSGMLANLKAMLTPKEPDPMKAAAKAFVAGMDALQLEVEDAEDAFLLDPGMGPMTYLAADGRILLDHRTWDDGGLRETTEENEAIGALVVGAKKTGLRELLSLIPACPPGGSPCPQCDEERLDKTLLEKGLKIICTRCRGRGWVMHVRE